MFFRFNIAGISWAVFIFILCAIPGYSIPHYEWADLLSLDKLIHTFLFAVLSVLLIRGFKKQYRFTFLRSKTIPFVLLFCIAYGGLLELMQNYCFIDRSGSWFDFIANIIGSLSGNFIFKYFLKEKVRFFK
jgi:VanZ family protein